MSSIPSDFIGSTTRIASAGCRKLPTPQDLHSSKSTVWRTRRRGATSPAATDKCSISTTSSLRLVTIRKQSASLLRICSSKFILRSKTIRKVSVRRPIRSRSSFKNSIGSKRTSFSGSGTSVVSYPRRPISRWLIPSKRKRSTSGSTTSSTQGTKSNFFIQTTSQISTLCAPLKTSPMCRKSIWIRATI